jgi:hypothetical protein
LVTVGVDAAEVEQRLTTGRLACPGCAGVLAPWGHGRFRYLRGLDGQRLELWPRRGRCSGRCGRTHILLPVDCLLRRADAVEVIGAALEAAASGWGHRKIAQGLARPPSTVRGWLRRFCSRASAVAGVFTSLLVGLSDDPDTRLPMAGASVLADAVAAVIAVGMAASDRFPVLRVPWWWTACAVSGGLLLWPGWPPG